jgi:hypothetical protein
MSTHYQRTAVEGARTRGWVTVGLVFGIMATVAVGRMVGGGDPDRVRTERHVPAADTPTSAAPVGSLIPPESIVADTTTTPAPVPVPAVPAPTAPTGPTPTTAPQLVDTPADENGCQFTDNAGSYSCPYSGSGPTTTIEVPVGCYGDSGWTPGVPEGGCPPQSPEPPAPGD